MLVAARVFLLTLTSLLCHFAKWVVPNVLEGAAYMTMEHGYLVE